MAKFAEKQIPQRTIARESGVPFSTVCKIAQGSVKEPSVHTVQRLFDYFQAKQGDAPFEAGVSDPRCTSDRRHHPERREDLLPNEPTNQKAA